ncbi:hypothetical protein BG95_00175 [Thermosipho sp. 1063]|uniref:hypothetical protein n=1 Tax=unclassified Thermosipho (in: thermotogales) TaxID=2676525 RepID=UPI00094925EA|nr:MULTISPECIES: hypothetical protein [unclassified Thermosipho (in: thermotogales)]ANQ52967.1 hypothetical protein Y592_00175 [Thermosipho sp. 1070]APT71414.1 hypothetical protein BG95_00175 [Thermosipho sp. 1063]OOC46069.1 hypothetical protein XO08_00180 [Thermosipho sp. 1074]
MERLNLYKTKERRISIKKFLIFVIIVLIPFFSAFFLSQFWVYQSISKTVESYPLVFNNITFLEPLEIPKIVENEILKYDSKLNIIVNKITYYKNYLNKVYYSKYFLQELLDFFKKKNERFFIKSINFSDGKFKILFYEFSNQKDDFSEVVNKLNNVYKNVGISLKDTKTLYSDFKMFEFYLEGEL